MPIDLRIINNTIYTGVFTVISKNAMSGKVLARKVLGFKCVRCDPPHFPRSSSACILENAVYPILVLVCYIPGAIKGASIKLLDVNEVEIIMIILGEPQHPNF
jgi:hypothetical protein